MLLVSILLGCCSSSLRQCPGENWPHLWARASLGWRHQELHLLSELQERISWSARRVLCGWAEHDWRCHGISCTWSCNHFLQHFCRLFYPHVWPFAHGICFSDLCQLLWISLWCFYWWVEVRYFFSLFLLPSKETSNQFLHTLTFQGQKVRSWELRKWSAIGRSS